MESLEDTPESLKAQIKALLATFRKDCNPQSFSDYELYCFRHSGGGDFKQWHYHHEGSGIYDEWLATEAKKKASAADQLVLSLKALIDGAGDKAAP